MALNMCKLCNIIVSYYIGLFVVTSWYEVKQTSMNFSHD